MQAMVVPAWLRENSGTTSYILHPVTTGYGQVSPRHGKGKWSPDLFLDGMVYLSNYHKHIDTTYKENLTDVTQHGSEMWFISQLLIMLRHLNIL